ncbi:hypothetical protein CN167_31785 [Sinorhizobium medicae]|nr:hypothetical protein CN167_31785 [Sinorhizobium medicae]
MGCVSKFQERRRRWGDAKKLDVVMSIGLDGATVTEVAHRHDVSRQQIYAWRICCGRMSCRRAISATPEPLVSTSARIRSLTSVVHTWRPSTPVKISTHP